MSFESSSASSASSLGVLYVVATPIGNLGDITLRALEILKSADKILAEDTRESQKLLSYYGISRPMISLHDHNELARMDLIQDLLSQGLNLALISDAGTPLISDPGYKLVKILKDKNFKIIPIPGPSALIAALSASGLSTDKFAFLGFVPVKNKEKKECFEGLKNLNYLNNMTAIFYESTHRLLDSLLVLEEILPDRKIVLAKELTKQFEQIIAGCPRDILSWLKQDINYIKGEFVLMISPLVKEKKAEDLSFELAYPELFKLLKILLAYLSLKEAVSCAVKLSGENKNLVYKMALELSAGLEN